MVVYDRVSSLAVRRLLAPAGALKQGWKGGEQQMRSIVHKSILQLPENYPQPWDYKNKGYQYTDAPFDCTQDRFTQNSRLIVVEGNVASGKSSLARQLADQLGFYHMPEFKMDDVLIDRYGNDLRKFYHLFPKRFRIPDMQMFYKNPMDELSAAMQERIFRCRFDQYLNALAHIMNTGQGVVLERAPHSDFVFANAMRAKNYIGHEFFKYYYFVRKNALPKLNFWPHLVIYLDVPVAKCMENIRKRGKVEEIACLDEEYLGTIEESYKDSLREYRKHSKILAFDWSTPGDVDSVVEDIEATDLDFFEWHSGDVFEEWHAPVDEITWNGWRQYVTSKSNAHFYAFDGIETHDVGELYINPRDAGHFLQVMRQEVLKSPYAYGYNLKKGDEMAGMDNWRTFHVLPEKWYEYWWKELWYDNWNAMELVIDPQMKNLDPDYLHAHH
ncbi:unnamed protein product, partial [Mesorhabditis belari]|uniref:NADH dehydrogenase [ubiquinone] 1 alpha subcomplex subunit 10, mitochondrial n=1 Tax=Mesorhabditis belari TaxID=2138241 RepID=A0AAF3ERJ9_9BILA